MVAPKRFKTPQGEAVSKATAELHVLVHSICAGLGQPREAGGIIQKLRENWYTTAESLLELDAKAWAELSIPRRFADSCMARLEARRLGNAASGSAEQPAPGVGDVRTVKPKPPSTPHPANLAPPQPLQRRQPSQAPGVGDVTTVKPKPPSTPPPAPSRKPVEIKRPAPLEHAERTLATTPPTKRARGSENPEPSATTIEHYCTEFGRELREYVQQLAVITTYKVLGRCRRGESENARPEAVSSRIIAARVQHLLNEVQNDPTFVLPTDPLYRESICAVAEVTQVTWLEVIGRLFEDLDGFLRCSLFDGLFAVGEPEAVDDNGREICLAYVDPGLGQHKDSRDYVRVAFEILAGRAASPVMDSDGCDVDLDVWGALGWEGFTPAVGADKVTGERVASMDFVSRPARPNTEAGRELREYIYSIAVITSHVTLGKMWHRETPEDKIRSSHEVVRLVNDQIKNAQRVPPVSLPTDPHFRVRVLAVSGVMEVTWSNVIGKIFKDMDGFLRCSLFARILCVDQSEVAEDLTTGKISSRVSMDPTLAERCPEAVRSTAWELLAVREAAPILDADGWAVEFDGRGALTSEWEHVDLAPKAPKKKKNKNKNKAALAPEAS